MLRLKVERVEKVIDSLSRRHARARRDGSARTAVGYSIPYAVRIHEDLEMAHPNGGQAKYLEQPARTHAQELRQIIRQSLRAGMTFAQASYAAGLRLLQLSQALVPVRTGALKRSGYVRAE